MKVTKALQRAICKTCQVPQSDSREQVCGKIRTQWITAYQLQDKPKEFYTKSNDEASKSFRRTNSYWSYALELCDLQPIQKTDSHFIRIDHYWRKIGKILSDDGLQKYSHLICLVKCILSLSHGNSTPGRGFSINKHILRGMEAQLQRKPQNHCVLWKMRFVVLVELQIFQFLKSLFLL